MAFTSVRGHRDIFSPADPEPVALFSFLNQILNIKVSGSGIISQQKYFFPLVESRRILHSITGMKLNPSSHILLGRVTCHRAQSTQRSQTYTRVVTVTSWMVGCTSHRMYGIAQQPSEESQEESCGSHHRQIKLLSWHTFNLRFMHNPIFFFLSQWSKRTKKNVGEIKVKQYIIGV